MVHVENRKRSERTYEAEDLVLYQIATISIKKTIAHKISQKLASKHQGQYLDLERIGFVAYRLDLPSVAIQSVFHVSQLKKHIGNKVVESSPPQFPKAPTLQPQVVLNCRMVKRSNKVATQVLIHWKNQSPSDANWEFVEEFNFRFPQFSHEDKVESKRRELSRV